MVDSGRSEDAFVLVVIPLPTQGNNFFELECIVSDVNQGGDGEAPPPRHCLVPVDPDWLDECEVLVGQVEV